MDRGNNINVRLNRYNFRQCGLLSQLKNQKTEELWEEDEWEDRGHNAETIYNFPL